MTRTFFGCVFVPLAGMSVLPTVGYFPSNLRLSGAVAVLIVRLDAVKSVLTRQPAPGKWGRQKNLTVDSMLPE